MKTLIIYDNLGYILSQSQGEPLPREPIGVPFIWVEIPDGKRTRGIGSVGVDITITPHKVILEDIPPTETEILQKKVAEQELAIIELASMLGGN